MDVTQSGRHPYELPSWELGPKGRLLSRRVPATGLRPLAQGMREEGMRGEGMWSDAGREDGLWSDAGWATDILKRSRRPLLLLSFLFPFSFLTQQLVCTRPRIEASRYNPSPLVLVPPRPPPRAALVCVLSSAAAARRSCLCPVLGRRRAPPLSVSCPRPPPRADSCP
jgi:hypothetical protein